jgi:hypothetical protein
MSKMIAIRLQEDLLTDVDRERKRAGLTRAAAVHQALAIWVARRRHEEAVRQDQEGYRRHPVGDDEFEPVLGAQSWPK